MNTERDRLVMRLLADGHSQPDIARDLAVTKERMRQIVRDARAHARTRRMEAEIDTPQHFYWHERFG